MSDYIKPHSLSVGYNLTGQPFFDLLKKYEEYIHSYFFSFTDTMRCNPLSEIETIKLISTSDTYGIPSNLLLNSYNSEREYKKLVPLANKISNLYGVTILSPELAQNALRNSIRILKYICLSGILIGLRIQMRILV